MRQVSEADKRVSLIFITDKGWVSIEKGSLETDQLSETIAAVLSASELNTLRDSLTKIVHNVKRSQLDVAFFKSAHQIHRYYPREWNRSRFHW